MRRLLPLLLILTAFINPVIAQCDASFSFNVNGATAYFNADTSSPGLLHKWRLGDGNIAFGPNTSHTYNAPGVYPVWHIVADSLGQCSDSVMKIVNISFQASCQASFVYSRDSVFPNKYYFNSTSTASGGTISSYQWTLDGNTISTSSSFTLSATQGVHEICLSITTTAGCNSTTCDSIVVDSLGDCNLDAAFDTLMAGYTVTVEALSTGAYLSHFWKFGDGNTAYGPNATHTYAYHGSYPITHYITDSSSNCIDSAKMIIVINEPVSCQAQFSIKADSMLANKYHFFSQSVSTGGAIESYHWTINGNTVSTAPGFSDTLAPGSYMICLTIATPVCSHTSCDSLVVQGGGNADTCNLHADFTISTTGDTLQQKKYYFTSASSAQGGGSISYYWTLNGHYVSNNASFSTHLSAGAHTVCLAITSTTGCTDTVCKNIIVGVDSVHTGNNSIIRSYPNPIRGGVLNLQLKLEDQQKVKITVYNVRGVAVLVQERVYSQGYNRIMIPVDALQRGQYFIDIQYGNTRKRSVFHKL